MYGLHGKPWVDLGFKEVEAGEIVYDEPEFQLRLKFGKGAGKPVDDTDVAIVVNDLA